MSPGELSAAEVGTFRSSLIVEPSDKIRSRLEQVAGSMRPTEATEKLLTQTEGCHIDTTVVKDRAVRQVAKLDPKGTGVMMQRFDNLATEMDKLVSCDDTGFLTRYRDRDWGELDKASKLIEKYEVEQSGERKLDPLQRLNRAIKTNQVARVTAVASDVAVLCRNPNIPWNELVRQGNIAQDYLDNVDLIADYLEMATKWHMIEAGSGKLDSNTIKALKAKVFLPYLGKEISPEMIDQIVEGKFDMDEMFVTGALMMFTDLIEEIRLPSKKLTARQKMAMGVVMSSMVLTLASANYQLPVSSWAQFQQEISIDAGPKSEQDIKAREKQQEDERRSASEKGWGSKIENSGGELGDYAKRAKNVVWELDGKNLDGYFRTNTATQFYYSNHSDDRGFYWRVSSDYSDVAYQPVDNSKKPDLIATRVLSYLPYTIDLPAKYGQEVDPQSVKITADGVDLVAGSEFTVRVGSNGNFYINRTPTDKKGPTTVVYGLRDANLSLPHNGEKEEATSVFVNLNNEKDFPMYEQISQKYGNDKTKMAYAFRDWISRDFTYSLDPKQSNYYQAAETVEGFFQRAIDRKKVDCDVANTILIGHLRAVGIESRMVSGFHNAKGKTVLQLTENEAHAWVEAFLDGKWTILDATPTKMDRYTEKEMKQAGITNAPNGDREGQDSVEAREEETGEQTGQPGTETSLTDALKDAVAAMQSVKDWSQENPAVPIVLLFGLYKALLVKTYRRMQKVNQKGKKTHERVEERINALLINTEGKPLIPEQAMDEVKVFFAGIVDEKTSLPGDPEIGGFLKKTFTWFTLPLSGTYARAKKQEKALEGTDERLRGLPKKIGELNPSESPGDVDLVSVFAEMAGYERSDIERALITQNTNNLANYVVGKIHNLAMYRDVFPAWERRDQELVNNINRRLTEGYNKRPDKLTMTGSIRQARRFKEEQAFLRYLAIKAYKDYHKEATKRAKATQKEPKHRNQEEQKLAACHPLALTKREFIEIFSQNQDLRPFRVVYHLAHDQ